MTKEEFLEKEDELYRIGDNEKYYKFFKENQKMFLGDDAQDQIIRRDIIETLRASIEEDEDFIAECNVSIRYLQKKEREMCSYIYTALRRNRDSHATKCEKFEIFARSMVILNLIAKALRERDVALEKLNNKGDNK